MRKIKIGFADFYDGFDPEHYFITELLSTHFDVEITDDPDYLFYSVFGDTHLRYDCIRIFYTGENQVPDFNLCDYAIGFDRMDFGDRYFRLPIHYLYTEDTLAMERRHLTPDSEFLNREGFCSFVYSNNRASAERNRFFDMLSAYRPVASGGRFRNNVGGPVDDKVAFQQHYRFCIAFENSSYPGYTTEKLVQAFAAGAIPIYWGDPEVERVFNGAAFINCHRYASFEEVVEEVKRLDADSDAMLRMLHEPALADPSCSLAEVMGRLEDFLVAIVSQPLDSAKRYNRVYWGERYQVQERRKARAYSHTVRGLMESLYKKTLWKVRRNNRFFWFIDRLFKRR